MEEHRRITYHYGGSRKVYRIGTCICCGSDIWERKCLTGKTKYCSVNCFRKSSDRKITFKCAYCGTDFRRGPHRLKSSKSGLLFCSMPCKYRAQRIGGIKELQPAHYGNGKSRYRDKALRAYGENCMNIGCQLRAAGIEIAPVMLDVHHRNGDRGNNETENLQVLCVWCHAIETRSTWSRNSIRQSVPSTQEKLQVRDLS